MGKMQIRIWCMGVLLATAVLPAAGQAKVVKQIGLNAATAIANELLYKIELDSISKQKEIQKLMIAPRLQLSVLKEAERTALGNFGHENRAYKMALYEIEQIAVNASKVLRLAAKTPGNAVYYRRSVAMTVLTATESINKVVRLAMNGKVKKIEIGSFKDLLGDQVALPQQGGTAAGAGGSDKINDGLNLLSQVDRLKLIEDCIVELRAINCSLSLLAIKMETDVRWSSVFANSRVVSEDVFRTNDMAKAFQDTKRNIESLKLF